MKEDYMIITGDAFSDMRVQIEGAVVLYEGDAGILTRLAAEAKAEAALIAFDGIGGTLYALRKHIKQLQVEHLKEDARQRVS